MDLEWAKLAVNISIALGSGGITAVGAYFALKGEIKLHNQRITALENAENTAVELRLTTIERKLGDEKFQEFWEWKATVNNRLAALEKKQ